MASVETERHRAFYYSDPATSLNKKPTHTLQEVLDILNDLTPSNTRRRNGMHHELLNLYVFFLERNDSRCFDIAERLVAEHKEYRLQLNLMYRIRDDERLASLMELIVAT